ncbi:MAG: hypothetical protein ASQ68_gp15 [Yellowstone Lake virophage 6]|uniref:hypothetical protein n=1 Tax=Yellowstone Lake virophage 6 TaxID=1557034 RepID=UPI0005363376|nr:MAG: hypothetical protein ASQ68_gp15 [Yellowstone Lake virophage 6]AIW01905.1 MAG: hypothetical protein YSLV6_ORF15 [Yellowstone Lake virophage 6]
MESLDLSQLTLKYFVMESEIDKMNKQKEEYQAQITQQYNLKGELWVLIKKKQKELEDEIEENKKKLHESIVNNKKARETRRNEKLKAQYEERIKRESDPEFILQKEKERAMNDLCYQAIEGDDLNWHSGKRPNIIKTQKIKNSLKKCLKE